MTPPPPTPQPARPTASTTATAWAGLRRAAWCFAFALAVTPVTAWAQPRTADAPRPDDGVIRKAPINAPAPTQPAAPAAPPPTTAEIIDWDDAFARLGDRLPDGSTLVIGLVEGNAGAYGPDPQHGDLRGVDVTLESGPSTTSGHAQRTAGTIVGRRGLLPRAKRLRVWSVNDWLTHGYLNVASALPPRFGDDMPRVFSHSWISTDAQRAAPVLRRVDFQIDTRDVIMCVGVNNKRASAVPPMLAGSYNAIAVGVDTGNSSGGYTTAEGVGRCKPDLVAPGGMTSFSTPAVAGCAGILLEQADRMVKAGSKNANRAEVIKAVLMAGAVKHKSWKPAEGRPLDEHLGAGRVNLDTSLRILAGGPVPPNSRVTRGKAWSFAQLPAAERHGYEFRAPRDLGAFSVILTWHRRIEGRVVTLNRAPDDADGHNGNDNHVTPPNSPANNPGRGQRMWLGVPMLADLDLRLVRLGDSGNAESTEETVVAQSVSRIDNVEHLYLPKLPAGRYRLEVFRDPGHDPQGTTWDYALAWRLELPGK